MAGVISVAPGYRIKGEEGWKPVALAGRVEVRFTGTIAAGDYVFNAGNGLASSGVLSLDNMAEVVGKALEGKDCTGECKLWVMTGGI